MTEKKWQQAFGKIILTGEHAVVYGARALAGAIPGAVRACVVDQESDDIALDIPAWQSRVELGRRVNEDKFPIENKFSNENKAFNNNKVLNNNKALASILRLLVDKLSLSRHTFCVRVEPNIPAGTGLGASAALAVATIRALDYHYALGLSDEDVNALAFACEQVAHGTPSGVDNTVASFGGLLQFSRIDGRVNLSSIACQSPLPLLVVQSGERGSTVDMLAKVAAARQQAPSQYDAVFAEIDGLTEQAVAAIDRNDLPALGSVLTHNQCLLTRLGVSTPTLDTIFDQVMSAGALGAKLTGSGGGGALIALCHNTTRELAARMTQQGYQVMEVLLGVS